MQQPQANPGRQPAGAAEAAEMQAKLEVSAAGRVWGCWGGLVGGLCTGFTWSAPLGVSDLRGVAKEEAIALARRAQPLCKPTPMSGSRARVQLAAPLATRSAVPQQYRPCVRR